VTCLGIDPSSRRIAVAALKDNGDIAHHVQIIPDLRGARRLHFIRRVIVESLQGYGQPAVVVVEIPWAPPTRKRKDGKTVQGGSSFVLLSIAGVLMEAAQEAFPGAVVLDMPTQSWKRDSVGRGNASIPEYVEHAQGLGMVGDDIDVAAALCMAQAGFESWARRTESEAA
jgi:Holliday junction resolvasome RuvABC endonuclease subunit